MKILSLMHDSIVDGPGLRTVIFFAGCPHACPGCHNPESWLQANGHEYSFDELITIIDNYPMNNITFSGGEPMIQANEILPLATALKLRDKTIWCYTGYTYEWLKHYGNREQKELLTFVDVLVDGPFIERLKDSTLLFRGSSNQRLLTLEYGEISKKNQYASV
ncbi:anaerobic ribonucleoside-triphosphate reductase activating protein [Bacillus sp. A301a_S52]|nr:anaerobic ribonucleoside-triphosphate reductase activating protein [Bacillus sp. A301a_S52]